jgi:replicative DNA helicase
MNDIPSFSLPEIEQGFLSCLMNYPVKGFQVVADFKMTPAHFQHPRNRLLFAALENHWRNAKPIDLILLTNTLRESGFLETIGGAHFITETWLMCYSEGVLEYYAGMIVEEHAKRLIAVSCGETLKEVAEPLSEPAELVHSAVQRLTDIPLKPRKERTLMEAVEDMLQRKLRGEDPEDMIRTGLNDLDQKSPLRGSDMPLIVGQRKAGKTILALSIALNIAQKGIPVLIFSVEDKEPKILERLFAAVTRKPMGSKPSSDAFRLAADALIGLPIHIKDDIYDLAGIRSVSVELKKRCNIGLIIVDYAQKVVVPKQKGVSREQEVAEISRELRLLAMELDTPVIVLSQLNSDNQSRESRALEQDCTACWWILEQDDDQEPNTRIISIPYQRNGPGGIHFKVTFLGAIARVENYHAA